MLREMLVVATQNWITVVSVALAALAATASWASVRLSRRQWLLTQQPFLRGQVIIRQTGERELRILNAGAGAARGLRFCVAVENEFAAGYAGPQYGGLLAPGATATVVLDLAGEGGLKAVGVVLCWDAADRVHQFTMEGKHRVLRRRSFSDSSTDPEAAFENVYGRHSLGELLRVGGTGRKEARLPKNRPVRLR